MGKLFALLISILIVGCKGTEQKIALPLHHVDAMIVKVGDVPYDFDYPASINGVADFQVIPRVSGMLFKQLYIEGTTVKKNQALYQIDSRPYQNQLLADQGQLLKDQTAATEYKSILTRYKELYKVGGVSKQDIEMATINYNQAVGLVQADTASIQNDKLNIEYCTVRSPVDGLISERQATVGSMVSAYQTVLNNINSRTDMFVNFSVPENDRLELQNGISAGRVEVPKDFMFSVDLGLADGTKIESAGLVKFFDTRISLQNGTWNMRANINSALLKHQLLSGQYVHVYLKGAFFKNAIAVPQASVFRDGGGAFVYLVNTSNKIEKVPVITGVMNSSLWVVDSGLKDKDRVVTNGGMKVTSGEKVIIDSTEKQA